MDGELSDLLTRREHEVLDLLREGLTNAQIAERLDIASDTVKHHVSRVIAKLGVRDRREAAYWPERPPWWWGVAAPIVGQAAGAAAGVAVLTLLGGLAFLGVLLTRADGGSSTGTPIAAQTVPPPNEVILRSRWALFNGADVVHVTVSSETSHQLVEYAESWIERPTGAVRLRIHPQRLQAVRPEHELLVDGRTYLGLSAHDSTVDPLERLLPLGYFLTPGGPRSSDLAVSSVSRTLLGGREVIRLIRYAPESTAIEVQCAWSATMYFDAQTFLPLRAEYASDGCGRHDMRAPDPIVANFAYESVDVSSLPAGFFDPQVLYAENLADTLASMRSQPMTVYWNGPKRLIDYQGATDLDAGVRLIYGVGNEIDAQIIQYPAALADGARCPLREGPGGIVVGDLPVERVQTALGVADYCPSDGWLRVTVGGTRIYIWPPPGQPSREGVIAVANALEPVT